MGRSVAKIGLIGTGTMGMKHLTKLLASARAEIVGFHDTNPEVSGRIRSEFGLTFFANLDDLFFEADGVFIASPTGTHYPYTRRALEAGTHVFVEKPLAETVEEAERLIEIARRQRVSLQVGHVERFRFLALQKHFSLGSIRFFQSTRLSHQMPREAGIDVIADLMVHDLDLLGALMNTEPTSVQAQAFSIVSPWPDLVDAWMEFPDGCSAHLKASRVEREPYRQLRLCGDRGVVSLDFISNEIIVRGETLRVVPAQVIDALELQCQSFLESILDGIAPIVNGDEALRALKLCDTIRRVAVLTHRRIEDPSGSLQPGQP